MNWESVAFDWNQVRGFLATVEEGSLSAAARALGQTQPTVGRQVAALEEALGVVLFERIGRGLILTPSGLELVEHVRAMGEAAARVSLAASGQSQAVEGLVRITASDMLSAFVLPPILARLHADHPKIEIDVVAADDILDLQHREADIAVRHVRPEQPELIAKLAHTETARFYAATAYLDRMGRPKSVADLKHHDIISPGDPKRMIDYMANIGVPLDPKALWIRSESGVVTWQLAQQGLGIIPMSDRIAQATPGVEPVLAKETHIEFPVWLTTHRELHTSRRIRIVFDLLAEALSDQPIMPRNLAM